MSPASTRERCEDSHPAVVEDLDVADSSSLHNGNVELEFPAETAKGRLGTPGDESPASGDEPYKEPGRRRSDALARVLILSLDGTGCLTSECQGTHSSGGAAACHMSPCSSVP